MGYWNCSSLFRGRRAGALGGDWEDGQRRQRLAADWRIAPGHLDEGGLAVLAWGTPPFVQ